MQGSNLAYNIDIYISGITLTDYNCRLAIKRPDGETSNTVNSDTDRQRVLSLYSA